MFWPELQFSNIFAHLFYPSSVSFCFLISAYKFYIPSPWDFLLIVSYVSDSSKYLARILRVISRQL